VILWGTGSMPETSSPISSVAKWIGGILATVISGLLLFLGEQYIANRLKSQGQELQPPAQNQTKDKGGVQIVTIDGRVVDTSGTKLIDNAEVQLLVASTQEKQQTDSEGRYAFSLVGFDPEMAGSMSIDAPGYKQLRLNLFLSELGKQKEHRLEPIPPQGGGAGVGGVVGGVTGGGKGAAIGAGAGAGKQVELTHPYIMRADIQRIVPPR
jgi:hypothetical protein